MSELLNYSVETDQSVWLSFKDGRNFRVSFGQLPRYLAPRDLVKVRRAIKLRHDFFRHNMPRTIALVAALGLATVLYASEQALAHIWSPGHTVPAAGQTEMVRNIEPATQQPTVMPAGSAAHPATAVKPAPHTNSNPSRAAKVIPVPTIKPAPDKLRAPAVEVTPIVTLPSVVPDVPAPTVSPLPSPLPTPDVPAAGKVPDPVKPVIPAL